MVKVAFLAGIILLLLETADSSYICSIVPRQSHRLRIAKTRMRYVSSTSAGINNDVPSLSKSEGDMILTEEEEEFIEKLCSQRNISFENIRNARDLASSPNSPILANRLYRSGRLSDASPSDIDYLLNTIGAQTLIDLRSPTELRDDPNVHSDLFHHFNTLRWNGKRDKEIDDDFSERRRIFKGITRFYNNRLRRRNIDVNLKEDKDDTIHDVFLTSHSGEEKVLDTSLVVDGTALSVFPKKNESNSRNRYFISLMNEFKYVRGTLSKLRKRDITRALLKSPGAIFSKRVRAQCKNVFISEINDGGLPLLNELVLRWGASGISHTLDLISNQKNHPVLFYCTAGKDRTGIIAAIVLQLLGVPVEEIVEDYSLSANVYAEMDDHKAMVGALSQRNLDPKTFLGAPPQVMRDTLEGIRQNYGSLDGYLDFIGFNEEKRQQLKKALTT